MIANQRATTLVNESMGIQKGYVNSSLIIYGNHIYSMSSYSDKESFLSENKVRLIVSGREPYKDRIINRSNSADMQSGNSLL